MKAFFRWFWRTFGPFEPYPFLRGAGFALLVLLLVRLFITAVR